MLHNKPLQQSYRRRLDRSLLAYLHRIGVLRRPLAACATQLSAHSVMRLPMHDIPGFTEACFEFQAFLRDQGAPTRLHWVFREDFYSLDPSHHCVRWPVPSENTSLAEALFEQGRSRGLVELTARFTIGSSVAASVLAPEPDEIQGWSQGFKLCKITPFAEATSVRGGLRWAMHRWRAPYQRFQKHSEFVPSRRAAA